METITLNPTPKTFRAKELADGITILQNLPVEHKVDVPVAPFRLGPVFFSGRSPFRIRVIILTCFGIPEESPEQTGAYITYVGYKKEKDDNFDFDEMIPSTTYEEAEKTHTKACGFFGNSSLFIKTAV